MAVAVMDRVITSSSTTNISLVAIIVLSIKKREKIVAENKFMIPQNRFVVEQMTGEGNNLKPLLPNQIFKSMQSLTA